MGRRALCTLPVLQHALSLDGIQLELEALVDVQVKAHEAIESLLQALVLEPRQKKPFVSLAECLSTLQSGDKSYLVYDASPSTLHLPHLILCCKEGFHYLGEKPLVMDPCELMVLRDEIANPARASRIMVDFIETHSSPTCIVASQMKKQAARPTQVELCREGSGGLKKLLFPSARKGIAGGAILDKAVHDLSILHALLFASGATVPGHHQISLEVFDPVLMPADIEAVMWGETRFLGADNEPRPLPKGEVGGVYYYSADARARIELTAPDWTAVVHTSWLGVRRSDELLGELGFPAERHIGIEPQKLFGSSENVLSISDCRIGRVETTTDSWFVDFLYKNKDGAGSTVRKLNSEVEESFQEETSDPVWRAFPANPLGRVLATACRTVLGRACEPYSSFIDEKAILWVHELAIAARKKVLHGDAEPEMAKTREAVKTALEPHLDCVRRNLTIQVLILDMDNTLFATGEAVPNLEALRLAFERNFDIAWEEIEERVLTRRPNGLVSELVKAGSLKAHLQTAQAEDDVFGAYGDLEVAVPNLVAGYNECRDLWSRLDLKVALVTTGIWILQAKKIQAAGIAKHFTPVVIDDARCELGKESTFEAIMNKLKVPARRVAVVGDDKDSELEAARALGMRRVHITTEPGCACGAREHIRDFHGLTRVLDKWTDGEA